MYEFHTENERPKTVRKINWKTIAFTAIVTAIVISGASSISAPRNFPIDKIVTIASGSSLDAIAKQFEEAGIIKSVGLFKTFVVALTSDKNISDGDYMFNRRLNAWQIAERLAFGRFGIDKVRVTLFEGLSNKEMSEVLAKKLKSFNQEEFLYLTKNLEGYMFPDTYHFFGSATAVDVVKAMRDNFNKKVTEGLGADIEASDKTFDEIITMASIIQDEAHYGYVEKQTISGILWKRIAKGMLLQVDASLRYVNGKDSASLTIRDLEDDNPYNTYVYKGLPPTPIGNPGIDAIKAAIYPMESPYFFYLHDKDAKIHYAKTYAEHKQNISAYLR